MTKKQKIKQEAIDKKAVACIGCDHKVEIAAYISDNCLQQNVAGTKVTVDCSASNSKVPIKACGESSFKNCSDYNRFKVGNFKYVLLLSLCLWHIVLSRA